MSAAARGGSIVCISRFSHVSAVRHGLRRGVQSKAALELAGDAPQPEPANAICMTPAMNAYAATSASRATAPSPGFQNMITPNATESSPLSTSSSDRPPLNGTTRASEIEDPGRDRPGGDGVEQPQRREVGQTKTTMPTATPRRPSKASHARRLRLKGR